MFIQLGLRFSSASYIEKYGIVLKFKNTRSVSLNVFNKVVLTTHLVKFTTKSTPNEGRLHQ